MAKKTQINSQIPRAVFLNRESAEGSG